ncbi:cyclin-dependent kinase inhibitor 1 isoform X1 [Lepisosteus oculatus]|uniref:cyclin-dependent kinase inhibitor 1 isoform X1 n=2 Tax=Lepisosteus oculatus TaxID=7918 RepID=UPI003716B274
MCGTVAMEKRALNPLGNAGAAVCRSLFGPVDREELQAEYRALLRRDLEASARRWGFDFLNERPLAGGDFEWEGVPGAKVPALYRTCMVGQQRGAPQGEQGGKENEPRTPERTAKPRCPESTPEKSPAQTLKRKQTNITDFYQAKRRLVATPRKSGQ